MNEFLEKMKVYLDKSVEVSKEAVKTAGARMQDFGDKSMTLIEIKQLESKIQHSLQQLGLRVFELFSEDADKAISMEDEVIQSCVNEITCLNKEIDKRNSQLNKDKQ